MLIRKAKIADIKTIHTLLMRQEDHESLVLPRSFSQLYSHLRDFFVAEQDGKIYGCVALSITWADLAEVRSLVVSKDCRGGGIGRKLVDAALSEAVTLGIYSIFTLTEVPGFFEKMGFKRAAMDTLNQKIWADCLNCPRFPELCNEVAMTIEL
ncbi:N-acetyltransferase [Salidesulfovibrio brasiliensis]|uniref:N-acetyltransferase n=1 Tax=Salidesulfovibrio brasiliensis TaxID=221711 RepID=UPI0006CF52DC|nr:N-acetyltransferase [Salidesulfovibrio brasiliensis]